MTTIKKIWIIVLVLSLALTFVLILLPFEVYFGIDMPFVIANHEHFSFFGYEIPADKQYGAMLLMGLLLMLPGRLIPLAFNKLMEKPKTYFTDRDESDDEIFNPHGNYNSMYFYDDKGNRMRP